MIIRISAKKKENTIEHPKVLIMPSYTNKTYKWWHKNMFTYPIELTILFISYIESHILTSPVSNNNVWMDLSHQVNTIATQSEIYRRGNVENVWNSSFVRRSPSKAIIGFSTIYDYLQCRKCRFPDVDPRRKRQGFCSVKSSEIRLKHALRNSLSMYLH